MYACRFLAVVVGLFAAAARPQDRAVSLPAFPGAEGFGACTPGGRGGKVIPVSNLEDGGPGSLRAALEAEGPRLVVFRVAGTIEVKSPIRIVHPYVTVAGQTAPGGGITLRNAPSNNYAPLQVKTHDVVLRYLRSRPGPSGEPFFQGETSTVDALTIGDPVREVYNVVVDHCSFSWSLDEVVNSWYAARDLTVQWCILSEGLHNRKHRHGSGSKGPLFGGKGGERVSFHHNLLAHNLGRNPMVKSSGVVDIVNNVIFVPGTVAASVDGELGHSRVNFVGNTVSAPRGDGLVYGVSVLGPSPVSLYVEGNTGPHRSGPQQGEHLIVRPQNDGRRRIEARRHEAPLVTTLPASDAYARVLERAGCVRPRRDAVDERVVADVREGRPRLIDDPSEVGGWPELEGGTAPADADGDGMPDAWERDHGLNPQDSGDGSGDLDGDGYTNVEEFLNGTSPRRKGE